MTVPAAACAQPSANGTALRLSSPRAAHSMVRLADGSVLFIGGCVSGSCETGPASTTVDRFNPETCAITLSGRLLGPRTQAALAALDDGTVLVAGGWSGPRVTASVERYDPRRGTSSAAAVMSAEQICQAITLSSGNVLLVGERSIELFDPTAGKLRQLSASSPYLDGGTATLLVDGTVLIVGGGVDGPPRAEAYRLDPANGRYASTGSLSGVRRKHAAVRLLDSRVLVVGGSDARDRNGGKMKSMEVYDPSTGEFTRVGETHDARYKIVDAAVRLSDGRVLLAGGAETPEIIDPKTWRSRNIEFTVGDILNFATAVALDNGDVLVAGGYTEQSIRLTDRAWIIPSSALASVE